MSIMNLISEQELQAMDRYRRLYAYNDYTSEANEAKIEYILRYWEQNKSKYLFNLLGKNLIYSKEIKYERPYNEIYDKFYDELNKEFDSPLKIFREYFTAKIDKAFNVDDYKNQPYWICLHLLEPTVLASNKANINCNIQVGDKKIQIQTDSKPVKVLKKIVNALDLDTELFEKFRVAHSLIHNQKIIKGELCLSIHPFDYMTMSDNDSDWESCMSWIQEGCYRRGTVDMMNSDCVVVAYIKASHDAHFSVNMDWNNKKWRQLFIVTKDFITGVKGYPYHNLELEKEVVQILGQFATENLGWEYYDQCPKFMDSYCRCSADPKATIETADGNEFSVHFFFETDTMYNDFHSECINHVLISTDIKEEREVYFNYSGPVVCMCCGETGKYYEDEEACYLVCDDCGNAEQEVWHYCDNCGCAIYDPYESVTLDSGQIICDCCHNEEQYFTDPITNYDYADSKANKIFVVNDNYDWDGKTTFKTVLTSYHSVPEWNDYFTCTHFEWTNFQYNNNTFFGYRVKRSNCTELGIKLFDK